ncbi:hypothetical protein C2845_PM03G25380 [Panicum miliaceum]|uniref:Uncharacterized protein n=1 Tax=Panicum miliaceum TaxID=4540 RepID=A0A3L6T909_PANMI|nr:hypothetical protein C2845_PM03G25380 [Panicum miliaceum]
MVFRQLDAFFETVLSQHMEQKRVLSKKDNPVDVLISLWKGQGRGLELTKDDLKAIILDALIGGTATSSVTLLWAMSELIKNPRVMKKVQFEIRGKIQDKPRVQETLRLHPPAPLLFPRETMQHVKIHGYDLPPKTRVFVNAWAIGRDTDCWKNPEEFYRERFEDVGVDFQGLNFEFLPFGAGRRICSAIPMANMNVEFTLASLLHSFDWKLPVGLRREDVSMEEMGRQIVCRSSPLCLFPFPYM